MDRGAWQATVHGLAKNRITEPLTLSVQNFYTICKNGCNHISKEFPFCQILNKSYIIKLKKKIKF